MKTKPLSANVSKLKLHLGKYLAMVRRGKAIIVLDRSTPVAKLVPYSDDASDALVVVPASLDPSGLACLVFPAVAPSSADSTSSLLEERKERI